MNIKRRNFIKICGLGAIASQLPQGNAIGRDRTRIIKPNHLKPGDTVGLISPAGMVETETIEQITQTLATLGLKVKLGRHVLDRYGYLAGKDSERARDLNMMFADDTVQAILTMRGGWGSNRILPLVDYSLIRKHPKIFIGFSDITSLLLAIYAKTGLITFHGLTGNSSWNGISLESAQRILLNGEAIAMQNPPILDHQSDSTQLHLQIIRPGKARGKLIGGNLSVLAAMVGSSYLPNWRGSILFLEDIKEEVYRVDRLLTQLKLAGILDQISGFVFGYCTECDPETPEKSLTLIQVLQDHILPLRIPAWYGFRIGHMPNRFTMPIGVEVEINASTGTVKMLESATR